MHRAIRVRIRSVLPKNKFLLGVGALVGGTAGAQLIAICASPILTRLYTPAEFGLLGVFNGILVIIAVVSAMRYELAIPIAKDDVEASNTVVLSILMALLTSLLISLSIPVFGAKAAKLLHSHEILGYLWLLPLGVLLISAYRIFSYWAIRRKLFSLVAKTKIKQSIALVIVQLTGYKFGAAALIGGQIAGQAAGGVSLSRIAKDDGVFTHVSWQGIKSAARRYRRYPIFDTWQALFNSMSVQAPPILFAAFFGLQSAGQYSIAQRVLTVPLSLIGTAVANVFIANAAEAHKDGSLGPLITNLHKHLAYVAMPPALILAIVGPDLFAAVLGENWREAGSMARWMVPWLYTVFLASPITTLFLVLERQAEGAFFQGALLVARIATLYLCQKNGGPLLAVAAFSVVSMLFFMAFLVWAFVATGSSLLNVIRPTLIAIMSAVAISAPLIIATQISTNNVVRAVAAIITTALLLLWYIRVYRAGAASAAT